MDRVPHLMTAEQIDSLQILARRIVGNWKQAYHRRSIIAPEASPHSAPPPFRYHLDSRNDSVLRGFCKERLKAMGFRFFPPLMVQRHSIGANGMRGQSRL
jgi:hypothetical protein